MNFYAFSETSEYILYVKYFKIPTKYGNEIFIDSSIFFMPQNIPEWQQDDQEKNDLLEKVVADPEFRELMIFCLSIAQYDPNICYMGDKHEKWIEIWKDLISLGIVKMKIRWPCLEGELHVMELQEFEEFEESLFSLPSWVKEEKDHIKYQMHLKYRLEQMEKEYDHLRNKFLKNDDLESRNELLHIQRKYDLAYDRIKKKNPNWK